MDYLLVILEMFYCLAFEIFIPTASKKNYLSRFGLNQIIVDSSQANIPMLIIDLKASKSLIVIEQSKEEFHSIQTANVTVIFNHRVS